MTDKALEGFVGPPQYNEFGAHQFIVKQQLGRVRTVMAVKIVAVHGGGATKAPPTVDVQPMVNQVDPKGTKQDHGIIYGISVSRSFGGGNAVINDPVVGDVGIMSIHDRDISSLKANAGAQSNPGSGRRFDPSDGTYHGTMYPVADPTNYIIMNGGTIKIVSPAEVVVTAPGIKVNGYVHATGEIVAKHGSGSSVTMTTHDHSGVTPGTGNTAAPVPGT